MMWVALGVVIALGLVLAVAMLPVRIHLNLQGRGEPSGMWLVGGGGRCGPVTLSAAVARGVPAQLQAHVFGRKVWSGPIATVDDDEVPDDSDGVWLQRALGVARRFDPVEVATFALGEHKRVRLESLEADLDYSFRDVATTGKLMGAVYVLNGVLPERVIIRQQASWELTDRAAMKATASIRIWVGRAVVDTLVFVARNMRWRTRIPREQPD